MIISRTPFRISFFGGGTDYPVWYKKNGGAVISTTINKYCYLNCRYIPPFFDFKHRIVWSKTELVNEIDEITHPSVRETMRFLGIDRGTEIHHSADIPAKSGMGSSSAFTVGLLNALYTMQGKMINKKQLALDAIHIEQNLIRENVGSQDQTAAAFGGFNKITFGGDGIIDVQSVAIPSQKLADLQNNLMLFFSGFQRETTASNIAAEQIKNTPNKSDELHKMYRMVDDAVNMLSSGDIDSFGKLLNESWEIKKTLSSKISNPEIDKIYDTAMGAGALGGKLLGAGGGGFMLFYVRPENHTRVKNALENLTHIPFKFEGLGSHIIHYQPK
jgi:D-glycero-alpha-D-manno-heptose-7-phosphate kinase